MIWLGFTEYIIVGGHHRRSIDHERYRFTSTLLVRFNWDSGMDKLSHHCFLRDAFNRACLSFNDVTKSPLWHEWVNTSHSFTWMYLLMYAMISILVYLNSVSKICPWYLYIAIFKRAIATQFAEWFHRRKWFCSVSLHVSCCQVLWHLSAIIYQQYAICVRVRVRVRVCVFQRNGSFVIEMIYLYIISAKWLNKPILDKYPLKCIKVISEKCSRFPPRKDNSRLVFWKQNPDFACRVFIKKIPRSMQGNCN